MRRLYFYCFFCLILVSFSALFAKETPSTPPTPGFVSWTWDIPENIFDQYSIIKSPYWSDAKCPIGGGFRYVHLRNRQNQDEMHFGGYGYFRPLSLYFSDSIIVMGIYSAFETTYIEGKTFIDENNEEDIVSTDSFPFSVGFTMKWSLPRHNLQVEFEMGHYWSRVESEDYDLQFTVPPGVPLNGKLKRLQKETGISMYFGLVWTSERRYLSGIELNLTGSHPTGHKDLSIKISKTNPISLPDIPMEGEPTRTGTFIGLLYVKALAIELMDILPEFPLKDKHHSIMVEPVVGISYLDYHRGHGLIAGVRLNIARFLGLSYFHSFKQKSESPDVDVFRVELGLEIGGRLGGIKGS
ncbi:MAG: hypothetical protein HUU50_12190 [Candidatus Brocadiae bacterium]|nr:hypothetical protein [Candidatus Brocadiia bacterium]